MPQSMAPAEPAERLAVHAALFSPAHKGNPPPQQTGLALNIDMAATAMLESGELVDYM